MHSFHIPSARFSAAALLIALATITDVRATPVTTPRPAAPMFDELGRHHHPITTVSKEAQRYFDQGLMLLFNFNHKEAIRSFRAAAALDPTCAMAHWGEAFAYGPHVNAPMDEAAVPLAWAALQEAEKRASHANARERAYIAALGKRYAAPGGKTDRPPL